MRPSLPLPALRLLAMLCLSLGLSACTDFALRDLREAQYSGSAFQQSLALEYRQLAEDAAVNYDWSNSNLYANKGLAAAYGQPVQPETPAAREAANDTDLAAAYTALLAVVPSAENTAPKTLARAWTQYECWAENLQKHVDADETLSCRENFESAMKELEAAATPAPTQAPFGAEKAPEQEFYVLLFQLNSSTLNVSGISKLREIAADLAQRPDWKLMLNGHTDRSGAEDYNMALSERRAAAVKAQLIALGLSSARIQTFAFGETDPAVQTEDDVKEPANRRVELLLN